MNSKTINNILSDWPLRRIIGLAAGLFFIYQAFWYQDAIPGFLGAFFLFQAITNTGCLGSRSCAVPEPGSNRSENNNEVTTIEFTEINQD